MPTLLRSQWVHLLVPIYEVAERMTISCFKGVHAMALLLHFFSLKHKSIGGINLPLHPLEKLQGIIEMAKKIEERNLTLAQLGS